MLGSAQRRRVPLKLRPHMFVLCALCGLNNRSTSTAGAADRHLTRAHLPARHRRALAAAAAGPFRYVCDDCEMECPSRAELAVHVLDAGHGCVGFVCELCGEEGEGEANAAHHRLWHNATLPFQCYLCAERFATEPECVVHVRAEHAASFNIHRCARCPYATSTVGQFVAHARSHVGLNTCVCHECGVTFQTTQSLRRHLMTHSRSEFRCRHCDKTFRHPLPLERHERSQHDRPEDHKCSTCGKLFSSRYHLERHVLIHSGRRPHQCDRCGRGFVQKGDLARHVRKCRVGQLGEPLALQPPLKVVAVPAVCPPPPPPLAPPPPPPIAPPVTVLAPMPPPPPQQQSVLLHVSQPPVVMPLPAQGAG
ncbi:Zinc finger protein 766 [Amphibalanus amphitrite]|uniref:Zinc finger protein 766 n=1 Tax=Amphibalanus amphitrite TaxID=1232801 RepID=A0A6A4X4K0_AMPAM|nr:Zinc finger protein 766 [Amphibalanus amphitrite]